MRLGENETVTGAGMTLEARLEKQERLSYLADMLSELQTLAGQEGCETLAGLLALSHAEARRQVSGRGG